MNAPWQRSAEVLREATALAERYEGAWVETKPASVVVHSRRCSPDDAAALTDAVLAGPATRPGLRVQEGKAVVEMAVVDTTKGDAVALLSRLLGLAVMDGIISSNPCRSLPRARGKSLDADPVARALTDEQVARMLDLTSFHPFGQRALAGLAFTGLRLGELVGLRWEDVNVDRGLITVRRTFSPDGHGRLQVRATKSGCALSPAAR